MLEDLPGHYQRAIINEAMVHYNGHMNSKFCKLKQSKEEFLKQECSKLKKDAKKLAIKDSKILYNFPMKKDRDNYYNQKALEYAKMLDDNFMVISKLKGNSR